MGKLSAGGISVIVAALALSQKIGNYENKPLAIVLAVIAVLFLLWFGIQAARDGFIKLRTARSNSDASTKRKVYGGFIGAVVLAISVIVALIWGGPQTPTAAVKVQSPLAAPAGSIDPPTSASTTPLEVKLPVKKPVSRKQKVVAAKESKESSTQTAAAEPTNTHASDRGTTTGPVTVQPGGAASFGQKGGLTVGTLTNNGLMPARIQITPTGEPNLVKDVRLHATRPNLPRPEPEDLYKSTFQVVIQSQIKLPWFAIAAIGPSIAGIQFLPERGGMVMGNWSALAKDGRAVAMIQDAWGSYGLTVYSRSQEEPQIIFECSPGFPCVR
jgi:hypothetical protein